MAEVTKLDLQKAELKESLDLIMHCLQPRWREEFMDDDDYWEDEVITKEEYFRVKAWWIESGSFETLCSDFLRSFKPYYAEIDDFEMEFCPYQDDWVSLMFEFFDWWPDDFDEFAIRLTEGMGIDNSILLAAFESWWESSGPIDCLDRVTEATKGVVINLKGL